MNLLNQNPNYKKEVKSYTGYASLFILCLTVLLEMGGALLYILISNNYFN